MKNNKTLEVDRRTELIKREVDKVAKQHLYQNTLRFRVAKKPPRLQQVPKVTLRKRIRTMQTTL